MKSLRIFKDERFGEIRWVKVNNKDYAVGIRGMGRNNGVSEWHRFHKEKYWRVVDSGIFKKRSSSLINLGQASIIKV